jgi:hypothetical protein
MTLEFLSQNMAVRDRDVRENNRLLKRFDEGRNIAE